MVLLPLLCLVALLLCCRSPNIALASDSFGSDVFDSILQDSVSQSFASAEVKRTLASYYYDSSDVGMANAPLPLVDVTGRYSLEDFEDYSEWLWVGFQGRANSWQLQSYNGAGAWDAGSSSASIEFTAWYDYYYPSSGSGGSGGSGSADSWPDSLTFYPDFGNVFIRDNQGGSYVRSVAPVSGFSSFDLPFSSAASLSSDFESYGLSYIYGFYSWGSSDAVADYSSPYAYYNVYASASPISVTSSVTATGSYGGSPIDTYTATVVSDSPLYSITNGGKYQAYNSLWGSWPTVTFSDLSTHGGLHLYAVGSNTASVTFTGNAFFSTVVSSSGGGGSESDEPVWPPTDPQPDVPDPEQPTITNNTYNTYNNTVITDVDLQPVIDAIQELDSNLQTFWVNLKTMCESQFETICEWFSIICKSFSKTVNQFLKNFQRNSNHSQMVSN